MQSKTEQIIDASMKVFIEKGFKQATTQEIAKEANVAEVTLYRKFSTKQKLFEFVVQKALETTFQTRILDLANQTDTEIFIRTILKDRLTIISKNIDLIRLLISESILGNLPEELNFTYVIFSSIKQAIKTHFTLNNIKLEETYHANLLGSILLGHVILPQEHLFNKLSLNDQKQLIDRYTKAVLVNII